MTTDPFTDWMRDALTAVEAMAKGGGHESWHARFCTSELFGDCTCDVPATVLAMVEADRRLLEMHAPQLTFRGIPATCRVCMTWDRLEPGEPMTNDRSPCPTLRIRGAFWARLCPEGWREEWGPE